eukprot:scaffold1277_cov253-Pinguiococcus_pyrenoidosus.AAC.62
MNIIEDRPTVRQPTGCSCPLHKGLALTVSRADWAQKCPRDRGRGFSSISTTNLQRSRHRSDRRAIR